MEICIDESLDGESNPSVPVGDSIGEPGLRSAPKSELLDERDGQLLVRVLHVDRPQQPMFGPMQTFDGRSKQDLVEGGEQWVGVPWAPTWIKSDFLCIRTDCDGL